MDTMQLAKEFGALHSKLDTLGDAVKALLGSAPAGDAKAYNHRVLGEADVVIDGTTVNKDGSVWVREFGPTSPAKRLYFGYISPEKTPEIFQCANTLLGANYPAWFEQWAAQPYGIYRADVRSIISNGEMNYVLFGQLLGQPAKVHVQ